ncbi:MAG: YeeE/YedE family protein [Deltaproteobacteria bacterium]|nr:YeeE/YedE family protein [Deltaproteobacteria bacterium]
MHPFVLALCGGALIGLAATFLLLFNGRVAGVSGIAGGLVGGAEGRPWRLAFVLGMVGGGLLLKVLAPGVFGSEGLYRSPVLLVGAGLLVGYGTRMANGCTSGHGVCGLSRGSVRSLAATLTFMATGAGTVFLVRHLGGAR